MPSSTPRNSIGSISSTSRGCRLREIATRIEPQLREAGLWRDTFATSDREWLLRVFELLKPRIKKLGQIVEDGALFLAGAVPVPERRSGDETPGSARHSWASGGAARDARLSSTVQSGDD